MLPRLTTLSCPFIRALSGGSVWDARTKDPPFGNAVLWRGVSRLADVKLGFVMAAQLVGN
jgi:hypothetical protein